MTIPMRLRNLTWRVKEANTRVREDHERQRAIVHAQNRKQLQVERDGVSHKPCGAWRAESLLGRSTGAHQNRAQ